MDINQFYLGDWQVSPASNTLRLGKTVNVVEPKAMDVLLLLCQQAGEVLSADTIVEQCWNNTEIGDNPVHKAINQLRKALSDSASHPTYIETIRKRGYRIVCDVNFPQDDIARAQKCDWQGASPFPGLSAFKPSDSGIFFGRQNQVNVLLERLEGQIKQNRTFTLVLGPSGSGKSSLIKAGVLPKLINNKGYQNASVVSYTDLDFADVCQGRLWLDLAGTMMDWDVDQKPVFDGLSADNLASLLAFDTKQVVARCQAALNDYQENNMVAIPRLFLFVDRLEVLLSSPAFTEIERQTFLSVIEILARSGAVIVFSACRNDFYPSVVKYPFLMEDKERGAHFDLLPPTANELSQMIRLPAIAAGLSWGINKASGRHLDELLSVEAMGNPDSLPLLQYTLQELYIQRSDDNQLNVDVYEALGGIEGAIGKKAEKIYAELGAGQQQQLAKVLSMLVTLNDNNDNVTSRAARWSQLQNDKQVQLVQALVDNRLFVSHLQQNEPCFSVAHEALLRKWCRVSDWIATHRHSITVKGRINEQARRWLSDHKSQAYLLATGKPLDEALALMQDDAFSLEPHEIELIKKSQNLTRRKRWTVRATLVLLSVLTITSVFMSFRSYQAEQFAQQKRQEAESLLGFMVGEFADKLRSVRRMDLLDGISNKALEYFSVDQEQPESLFLAGLGLTSRSFDARFQHGQTLQAMGEVAYSRGKRDEAQQAFEAAKVILDKLNQHFPDNIEVVKLLGVNGFWLGQIHYYRDELEQARTFFELYRKYSQKMYELAPQQIDTWIELSYAYNTLGSLYIKQQRYQLAKDAFISSKTWKEQALAQMPEDTVLRVDHADTLSWIASSEQYLGDLFSALTLHQRVQEELEQVLSVTPSDAGVLESLAFSHSHQARILALLGQYQKAVDNAERGIGVLSRAAAQDPDNEIWYEQLLAIKVLRLSLISELPEQLLQLKKTDTQFQQQELFDKGRKRPNILIHAANFYQNSGQWQISKSFVSQAIAVLQQMIEQNHGVAKYQLALAQMWLLEARQMVHANRLETRDEACQSAINLLAPVLSRGNQNAEYLLPYVKAHNCLGLTDKVSASAEKLTTMGVNMYQFQQQR